MRHTDMRSPEILARHAVISVSPSPWMAELRAALEARGFTVAEVSSGQEALEGFLAGAALVVWAFDETPSVDEMAQAWCHAIERAPKVMPVTAVCVTDGDVALHDSCLSVGFDELFTPQTDSSEAASRLSGRVKARAVHHHLATLDPLTGLVTQEVFFARLDPTVRLSSRAGMPMAVAVLDLDHMRALERDVGRAPVREVLKDVAAHIKWVLRRSDTIARLGDDRFGLILHQITAFEARKLLYQLWKGLSISAETAAALGASLPRVTFTAGIAVFPGDSSDAMELYTRAEVALDVARASGHRRILLYSETSGDAGSLSGSTDLRYHRVEDTRAGFE